VDAISVIVIIASVMFASAVITAFLAHIKNRDVSFWAAWGFLFPPSLLVLVMLGRNKGPRPRRPSLDEEDKMQL